MTQKVYLSWEGVEKDIKSLSLKVSKENIDVIVAITKGGLPMATVMANKYLDNPPIITIQLKETAHGKQKANYKAKRVDIISPLNSYPIKEKRVLIVDDISDSGSTLIEAVKITKSLKPKKVVIATLYYKPRTKLMPDYWVKKFSNDTWVVHPWE
jgi:hypothetical protein